METLEAMQGRVVELEKENKSLQESLNTAQKDIVDLNLSSTAHKESGRP